MCRRITRMPRLREQRHNGRVKLIRSRRPISELRVPAGYRSIVMRDSGECVRPSRGRRVFIQPVLKDSPGKFIIEDSEYSFERLVEKSLRIRGKRSLEIPDLIEFGALFSRIKGRGWTG